MGRLARLALVIVVSTGAGAGVSYATLHPQIERDHRALSTLQDRIGTAQKAAEDVASSAGTVRAQIAQVTSWYSELDAKVTGLVRAGQAAPSTILVDSGLDGRLAQAEARLRGINNCLSSLAFDLNNNVRWYGC